MDALERHVRQHERLLTAQEYLQLAEQGFFAGERVELIRGRVVRMSPMGMEHAGTIQKMNKLLVRLFGDVADIRPQLPMLVSANTMPEPDFAIVDPDAPDAIEALGNTWIAIEVSDSSLRYDRVVKSKLYAEAGVPEFWLVDLRHHKLEVFTNPRGRRYTRQRSFEPGQTFCPARFPHLELKVSDLFSALKPLRS